MRIGQGYDAHRFLTGRPLVLGGVRIEHDQGLEAHSDGDVVLHALTDSLLGAAGLGDIGSHFSDQNEAFKDIDSRILVRRTLQMLREKGLSVRNVDITIVAQAPKLAAFVPIMRRRIAEDLGVEESKVNVKATTTERMGFTGRGEGIASYAVALLNE